MRTGIWERVIWPGRNKTVVDEENLNGRTLSTEELELERTQGHTIGLVGVGSDSGSGGGKECQVLFGGNEQGIAR